MPIWIIETAAAGRLNGLFLLIGLMTAPVWLAMLLLPRSPVVRHLASPLVLPVCYVVVPATLLFESWNTAAMPGRWVDGVGYRDAQLFFRNPVPFLLMFCNVQIANLVIGTLIYQSSLRHKLKVPVELVLSWFAGPTGLAAYALRLLSRRLFRRSA